MRVLCIGGGPAGLYLALLLKRADPRHVVRVVERNRAYDTFGWGVVFSDQTLGNLDAADPEIGRRDRRRVQPLGRHRRPLQGPHDHLGRPRLLRHRPQAAAQHPAAAVRGARRRAGVRARTCRRRGRGARVRRRPRRRQRRHQQPHARPLRRDLRARRRRRAAAASSGWARRRRFEAFTFAFDETPHGWFQAHAYQYDGETSTFIVETPEEVWQRAGLDGDDAGGGHRVLRAAVRAVPRRPPRC